MLNDITRTAHGFGRGHSLQLIPTINSDNI